MQNGPAIACSNETTVTPESGSSLVWLFAVSGLASLGPEVKHLLPAFPRIGPLEECDDSCFVKCCVELSANNLLGSDNPYVNPEQLVAIARLLAIVWKLLLLQYSISQRTNSWVL